MSSNPGARMVERNVPVYGCDRCATEAFETEVVGWITVCSFGWKADTIFGGAVVLDPKGQRHYCPTCTQFLEAAFTPKQATN